MEQKPKSWHCLWSHLHFSYPLPPPSLFSVITSSHSSFTYCSNHTSLPSSTRSHTILGPGICICCFCPGILFSWTSPGHASLLRVGIYSHILFSRRPSKTTLFKLATFFLKIVYCYLPPLFCLGAVCCAICCDTFLLIFTCCLSLLESKRHVGKDLGLFLMTAQFLVSGSYRTLIKHYWMMMILMLDDKGEDKGIAVACITIGHLVL